MDVVADQNKATIPHLEVGHCEVIWRIKHPWVEEGKHLKVLAVPLWGPALQPGCASITVLLWSASSWLNPSALPAWARQEPFRKQNDCMIHKFRGREVRADLLPYTGQRIASTYSGNDSYNFSLAQVCFPEESPPLLRKPPDTKKSVIILSIFFQLLIILLAKMCFFWLLSSAVNSSPSCYFFPCEVFFFFPSIENTLITESPHHSSPFCNNLFLLNLCPWKVFAELQIISAALYSTNPAVQNLPSHT